MAENAKAEPRHQVAAGADAEKRADERRAAAFKADEKLRADEHKANEERIATARKHAEARRKEDARRAALSPPERAAEDDKRAAMTPEERAKDDESKGLVAEQYDQINLLVAHILRNLRLIHRLGIAVNQHYFISRRSQRLQQEHPQMWHEVASHTVVRVVKQNFHDGSLRRTQRTLAHVVKCFTARKRHGRCQELAIYWN